MPTRSQSSPGFTLVEMAVVLVIMGLVMLTVFPALSMMRNANQRAATQSNLNALMLATGAYVQANGCLPCPTPATTLGPGFGHVNGTTTALACGACGNPEGIPPFVSLGVPPETARDGYGHWITMRVDPNLTANFGIVPPTAPCSCTAQGTNCVASSSVCKCTSSAPGVCTPTPANQSMQGLCQLGLSANTSYIKVFTPPNGGQQPAAVIFISYGANGYGSYLAGNPTGNLGQVQFPTYAFACAFSNGVPSNGYAQCNAANTNQFVDAPMQVDPTGERSYDDMLAFADRNTLVSRFGNGSCQTAWP